MISVRRAARLNRETSGLAHKVVSQGGNRGFAHMSPWVLSLGIAHASSTSRETETAPKPSPFTRLALTGVYGQARVRD